MNAAPAGGEVVARPAPERALAALGLALCLGCWSIPLSMVGETLRSPVHEFIVALVCALAALYGSASSRWLDRKEWSDWRRSLIKGTQFVAPFVVAAGWLLVVFRNVPGMLAVVLLSGLVWWVSADVDRVMSRGIEGMDREMGEKPSDPLRQLAVRFLMGGGLLFLAGAICQRPTVLGQQQLLPGTRWMIALGGYSLSGVALLSYARYVQVRQGWQSREAAISAETGTGLVGWAVALLALAAGSAVVVWFSLSSGLVTWGLLQTVRAGEPIGGFDLRLLELFSIRTVKDHYPYVPGGPRQNGPSGGGQHHGSGSDLSLLIQGIVLLTVVVAVFLYRYRKELRSYLNTARWFAQLKAWLWLLSLVRGGARGVGRLLIAVGGNVMAPITKAVGRRSRIVLFPGMLSPCERVLHYYSRMLQHAGERSIARRAAQTPTEFGASLTTRLSEAARDVEFLTTEFVEARYSRHAVNEGMAGQVRQGYGRIRARLRRLGEG